MFLHDSRQGIAVEHREDLTLIGDLHSRGIVVLVTCDDILTRTLGGNREFLAQFA